jgi:MIP family channel proteins
MKKRYLAEFIGTFFIVFSPIAVGAVGPNPGLLVASIASGFPVLAMIYALGPISAAHFNPAVTFAFAVTKRFRWKFVAPYWVAQLLGSACAAGLSLALFASHNGAHIPSDPSNLIRNIGTEITISALLMFVIMSVATDKRVNGAVPAIAIGLTVVVGVLIGGPITGGSMNPARSFGPAILAGGAAFQHFWIYIVGPMIGATIAAILYEAVRLEPEHAKGAPDNI